MRVVLLAVAIALPVHAQEQRYFDWADLEFAAEEYDARRTRLLEELAAITDGVLLIPSAEGTSHGPTFRQLDDFHYWTGLELPRSILLVDARDRRVVLYAPGRDARFENRARPNDFPGRPLADDPEIAERTGLDIRSAADVESVIARLVRSRTLLVNLGRGGSADAVRTSLTPDLSPEELLVMHLRGAWPEARIENAFDAVARVRATKSAAELAIVRRLAQITGQAIAEAAARVIHGVDERSLEGWFELGCKRGGAQRVPFHPIVKSGPNSLWPWRILASHYDRRNRVMVDGDLVIFDVGCELNHYVSDVGRTFPVSGSFTDDQRTALQLSTSVTDAIIAAVRPGVTLADLQRVADVTIPPDERGHMQTSLFFGHHLGLSTGDPVLTDEPLRPGMVFTVEPWYYNHDRGISVFVEDMILVTEDGAENLTGALPRDPAALAAMVAANRAR